MPNNLIKIRKYQGIYYLESKKSVTKADQTAAFTSHIKTKKNWSEKKLVGSLKDTMPKSQIKSGQTE